MHLRLHVTAFTCILCTLAVHVACQSILFHVFSLSFQSWEKASSDRYREKLLGLIGKIGKDDRTGKTASKVF